MKLNELASKLGLELRGDGGAEIFAPAPIEAAGPGMIILSPAKSTLRRCNRACRPRSRQLNSPRAQSVRLSSAPTLTLTSHAHWRFFSRPIGPAAGIDRTAVIASDAKIGENASIGAYAVIGTGVRIGRDAVIHPHVTIYPNVSIGDRFTAHSHASIREGSNIGQSRDGVDGAVIGADGFGFVRTSERPGQNSTIRQRDARKMTWKSGAHSTVDRAMMGATILRRGVKLDNQVHIGPWL